MHKLINAALKFIDKVNTGRARSVETYRELTEGLREIVGKPNISSRKRGIIKVSPEMILWNQEAMRVLFNRFIPLKASTRYYANLGVPECTIYEGLCEDFDELHFPADNANCPPEYEAIFTPHPHAVEGIGQWYSFDLEFKKVIK